MPLDMDQGTKTKRRAMSAEYLDAETEFELARAWRDDRCEQSLHRLTNAYMRLAVSMAGRFRRYDPSMSDLIQEAGIGLMKAADKFDPDRGVRFSSYAQWWIKASLQDFVMRNYSMVRIGSTSPQKSLFFNMKRIEAKLTREAERSGVPLSNAELKSAISEELGVPLRDVELMESRLSGGDFSLNSIQSTGEEEGREWIETLEDDGQQAEEIVLDKADQRRMRGWLTSAFKSLNQRERYIVSQRKLIDEPRTLESIGIELGLSKERIRQVETAALGKLRKRLETENGNAPQLMFS